MLVSEKKAAEFLGTSSATLRVLRCTGAKPGGMQVPPYYKLGRAVRYDLTDLEAYVQAHRVTPEGGAR